MAGELVCPNVGGPASASIKSDFLADGHRQNSAPSQFRNFNDFIGGDYNSFICGRQTPAQKPLRKYP